MISFSKIQILVQNNISRDTLLGESSAQGSADWFYQTVGGRRAWPSLTSVKLKKRPTPPRIFRASAAWMSIMSPQVKQVSKEVFLHACGETNTQCVTQAQRDCTLCATCW